jgi:hypothetical protein
MDGIDKKNLIFSIMNEPRLQIRRTCVHSDLAMQDIDRLTCNYYTVVRGTFKNVHLYTQLATENEILEIKEK